MKAPLRRCFHFGLRAAKRHFARFDLIRDGRNKFALR